MFFGDDVPPTHETDVQSPMPVDCTLGNLHARFGDNIGPGDVSTITVRKDATSGGNASDTVLTCTITENTNSCADTTNSVSFSAGDLISIEVSNNNGLGNAGSFMWTATCCN